VCLARKIIEPCGRRDPGPAKVLVMGLGVAALKRLRRHTGLGCYGRLRRGARKPRSRRSRLAPKFVETGVDARGKGGYAREL